MVYNKTKRGLEKSAGIVGLVVSILEIIAFFIMALIALLVICGAIDYTAPKTNISDSTLPNIIVDFLWVYIGYLVLGLVMLIFSIIATIFSSKVISSPVKDDGTLINRSRIRVCLIIFYVLTGNWVCLGLIIAVICSNDYVDENKEKVSVNVASNNVVQAKSKVLTVADKNSIEAFTKNLLELKHLNKIGVIEDANFKKAVQKIVDNFISEN